MVDEAHSQLSIVRQCQLLGVNRSTLYYQPVAPPADNLTLLKLIDQQYLQTSFYGSRRMTACLREQGYAVNRKRVQRLMHQLGLQAIYSKPKLSQPHPEHTVYPICCGALPLSGSIKSGVPISPIYPSSKAIFTSSQLWTGTAVKS